MLLPIAQEIEKLSYAELGLLSTMLNVAEADYSTSAELTNLCNDSEQVILSTLKSLKKKGFVVQLDTKYAVNKEIIPYIVRR